MIVTTVLSIDPELDADVLAVCAAGAALAVSDIPFDEERRRGARRAR